MSYLPVWIAFGAIVGFAVAWRLMYGAFPIIARVMWPLDDVRLETHPLLHRIGLCLLGATYGAVVGAFVGAVLRAVAQR